MEVCYSLNRHYKVQKTIAKMALAEHLRAWGSHKQNLSMKNLAKTNMSFISIKLKTNKLIEIREMLSFSKDFKKFSITKAYYYEISLCLI